MKKLAKILLATAVTVSAVAASSAVTAVKVDANLDKITHKSSVWSKAKFSTVTLYPQTTIKFNDKKANELNANNKAVNARVGAVYNGSKIAFIIGWPDGTLNIQKGYKTDSFADGFAVQFAEKFSNPAELPYIGMGSDGRPVVIHLQKGVKDLYEPNGDGIVGYQVNPNQTDLFNKDLEKFNARVKRLGNSDYERNFVSEGFRSMTEIKDGSAKSYARLGYEGTGWMGTLSRPMKDEYVNLDAAAIPVAFAVWDGEKMGRNGLKFLSSWTAVKLEGKKGGDALVSALHGEVIGDAVKGKEVVTNNGCAGCHQLEATDAPNLMGPSLTNIGGYATTDYLRESLVNPSAVVVPGYNRNAHSNFMWYVEENGKRTSTMTDFSWLEKADLDNMIAYLKTLKAEAE
ncbi:ethylbenzene dehydrogenase-related protein [Sulfurimonas sp.]|uniref:ethylbenzene dehydrogenase-related protein n=1 Tax=Sulfurimonas sp. TaxID=2022749 RepID=UPI00356475EC